MAEVSLQDLSEEQRRQLMRETPIAQLNPNQLGLFLNNMMPLPSDSGANDMTPYEFKKPENFKQGMKNFFGNAVGNPLMEALYLREPLEDRYTKMRIRGEETKQEQIRREQERRRNLAGSIDLQILTQMDYDDLSKIASEMKGDPTALEGYPGTSAQSSIFTNNQEVLIEPTTDQRNVKAAGGESEYQQLLGGRKGSEKSAELQAEIDLSFPRAIAERQTKTYNRVNDRADAALDNLPDLFMLQDLLGRGGVTQGFGANEKLAVRRIGESFGFDVEGTEDEGLFNSIVNQMALGARNPDSGMGMPGSMSDADRTFLQSLFPMLSNTPGANALLVEAEILKAKRKIKVRQMMSEHIEEFGSLAGFNKVLNDFTKNANNDLFTDMREKAASLVNQNQSSNTLVPLNPDEVGN